MPVARPESSDSRVIAHVDMDCFYVQVEQRKQPHLRGQPTAVVQYNSWKGGCLIAVSYEARKQGVKRSMRGDEAKHVCSQIQLVQVPVNRGKADLTVYRNAGSEVVSILARKGRCERASIDEVYLDLTEAAELMLAETPPESLEAIHEEAVKSHVLGLDVDADGVDSRETVKKWLIRSDADRRDKLLACGALLVAELRLQVLQETQFTCSAGIAHNKMLAKLVSGMNKPAQQTVVPFSSVKKLLEGLPIKKMKQLGGKLGTSLQTELGVETVGDLLQFPEVKLQERYGINTGTWLWNIARGINGEEVEGRLLPKSHGAGKTFPGPAALRSISAVEKWLNELCDELNERLQSDLEKNKRIAHTLTIHASAYKKNDTDSHKKFPSKSCPLRYGTSKIQEDALLLFQAGLREYLGSYQPKTSGGQHDGWGITGLSVSASKIVAIPSGTRSISNYFHTRGQICSSAAESNDRFSKIAAPLSPSGSESNSGVHSAVPEIESPHKEEKTVHALASFDLKENETRVCKDKDPSFSSTMSQQDGFAQEIVIPSSSDTQSCFTVNQTESQKELSGENFLHVRLKEKKTSSSKEKGTPSILNFFQSRTSSASPKQEHASPLAEAKASSSSDAESIVNSCFEALKQKNLTTKDGTRAGTFNFDQDEQRRNWSYKIDEIDYDILNELPLEIQEEVNVWLRPQKRANLLKKGSSIAHYFLPTKDK